jgi:uncharacterized membrane protein YqjE
MADPGGSRPSEASTAELLTRLSEQSARLVREELQLAKVEMTDKAKHAGIGAGLFSTAGIVGLFGVGALVAMAILALALVMPAWLASLVVGAVLLVAAALTALAGKKQVQQATPAAPQATIASVKRDAAELSQRGGS